ncbi:Asp23/Gls24 family envelope stress response protein [Kineococcus sp. NPDC059986]|uniref:Asp23/Gls24 family envelope stress response protein n=1 Tax=Kineococcus sp. NPDC059986 TaxID=3155538 RepID=UPI00344E3183
MTDETARPAAVDETGVNLPVDRNPGAAGVANSSGTAPSETGSPASPVRTEVPDTPRTTMTDAVVAKIAGIAASGVPGVHRLGGPLDHLVGDLVGDVVDGVAGTGAGGVVTRALDAVRPPDGPEDGSGQHLPVDRAVSVVVGEREASVTVDLTVEFGASVPTVAASVRREVAGAVERMTDLRVREVDVRVTDVHVPDEASADAS